MDWSKSGKIFEGLDDASQRHERKIVIEFPADRFLHFLGVYFIVLLAILSKVGQIVGRKPLCYSATDVHDYDYTFYKYAENYCWHSERIVSQNISKLSLSCAAMAERDDLKKLSLPPNSYHVKSFVQWFPYGLLIEAFLLCLPSAYWNFRIGARLIGHLRFIQTLQKDIYENVKILEKLPEEEELQRNDHFVEPISSDQFDNTNKGFTNRTIFSLLCQENISSFTHHHYLSSVFKLTRSDQLRKSTQSDQLRKSTQSDQLQKSTPLRSVILQQWCSGSNFGDPKKSILVSCYERKQLISIFASFVCFCIHVIVCYVAVSNGWIVNVFACDIPGHESRCVLCTFPLLLETFLIMIASTVATWAYLSIALYRLLKFQDQPQPEKDFLDSASDKGSLALNLALEKK